LKDIEKTLVPAYIRLGKYLDNYWGLTKFCVNQFKGTRVAVTKSDSVSLKGLVAKSKEYTSLESIVGSWTGDEEMRKIINAIESRPPKDHRMMLVSRKSVSPSTPQDNSSPESDEREFITPENTQNPEPPGSGAPFMPNDAGKAIPTLIPGHDAVTPTPGGGVSLAVM